MPTPRPLVTLATQLRQEADEIAAAAARAVEEQVPIYRQWRELGHGDELEYAIRWVMIDFLQRLETDAHYDASAEVLDIAKLRARQGLPAHAILSAWRVANHHLWRWLTREYPDAFATGGPGLELWSRYLEYADACVDQISDAFIEGHQDARTDEALANRARVDDIVGGLPPDETEKLIRSLGVLSRSVVIVACRSPHVGPDASAELVTDYGTFLKTARLATKSAVPWTMRSGNLVSIVAAVDGRNDAVVDAVSAGSSLQAGISKVVSARSDLGSTRAQAERALLATSGQHPVNDCNQLRFLEFAAMHSQFHWDDVPDWLRQLLSDERRRDDWLQTAAALARHHGNVIQAAEALSIHPNTVYYRIDAARSFSGADLRDPAMLADIELVISSLQFGTLTLS